MLIADELRLLAVDDDSGKIIAPGTNRPPCGTPYATQKL
jgi:hypothetical protein